MKAFFSFIYESGFVGWVILTTGFAVIGLVVERVQALYYRYNLNADVFSTQIFNLVQSQKIDEALALCLQMPEKPLACAYRQILEKSDRDDETIFQAQDIALSETVPLYTKRLHYLSMLANVATLLGLLGTIHGLILSFQAVAQADPTQKQALLASGIAVSMYTTALGLAVAIPSMVAYSLLFSKQNHLLEQLMEKCSKLSEILTRTASSSLNRSSVYAEDSQSVPPANNLKIS